MNNNPVKKPLFNPLSHDFTFDFRDDTNTVKTLTMPSMEISYFEGYQYEFMRKHLAETIYHERTRKLNHDDDIEEIKKEIEVV